MWLWTDGQTFSEAAVSDGCAGIWCQLFVQVYGSCYYTVPSTLNPNFSIQNTSVNDAREREAIPTK